MISIVMEAQLIPDGSKVFKTTGTQPYHLSREGAKVFDSKGEGVTLYPGACVMFRTNGTGLQIIEPTTRLRLDFNTIAEACEFLQLQDR